MESVSSEFRRHDTVLPVEVHIRKVDPGNTFILIGTENSFIINRNKSFKFRPELTDLSGQASRISIPFVPPIVKMNNIAKLCSMIP